MKNREYWQKRFDILQGKQLNKGIEFYHDLSKQYDKAAANVQKEIEAFYQRFAKNNELDLFEAKKLLNSRQLKEFRWSVEEYIEKGKTLNYSNQWAKELENASIRYRVSRLEALKLQMQQQIESLMGYEVDGLDNLTRQIYEDGYYHTIFELQKGTGIASSFAILDADKIDKVISKPWSADGTNFSSRIWGQHRPELVQKLNTDFTQALIRSDEPQKLINKIANDFNVSKYKAGRLVMTESAFFASASQKDGFKELGVEYFSVSATFDKDTCTDCGFREGEKIPMSLYEVGATAPPFHPNCRCDIIPADEDDEIKSYRAARDKNGNYIEVPSDMTYRQWRQKFVDGDGILTKSEINDKIKLKDVEKLEQAKKRDKKVYITDIAISKVPLVHVKGLSDEQNKLLQLKHKDLLLKAMNENDSNEIANVFTLDSIHNLFQFGSETVVKLSMHPTIADVIENSKENSVFVMHNHPSTQKFSYSDLGVLLANNSVFGISVITNTGELHILYKIDGYDKTKTIDFLRDIRNKYNTGDVLNESELVDEFLKKCSKSNLIYVKRGGKNGK